MLRFLRSISYPALRARLVLLYLLNLADFALTRLLLSMGNFREVNPLMALTMQSVPATAFVKILLPAVLLIYLDRRLPDADTRQLHICARVLNGLCAAYLAVNLLHVVLLAGVI